MTDRKAKEIIQTNLTAIMYELPKLGKDDLYGFERVLMRINEHVQALMEVASVAGQEPIQFVSNTWEGK